MSFCMCLFVFFPTAHIFNLTDDVYTFLSKYIALEEIILVATSVRNYDFTRLLSFLLSIKGSDGLCLTTACCFAGSFSIWFANVASIVSFSLWASEKNWAWYWATLDDNKSGVISTWKILFFILWHRFFSWS